ncbi:Protein Ycf2 [Bienertia sinuspersici]
MKKNRITSYGLVEDDSYLVYGLLEVERALPELRTLSDMMQKGSRSILDDRFLYRKYELEEGEGALFGILEYETPKAFYLIISKRRMSIKRINQSSYKVEMCNTRQNINLLKNRAFFE